jgi:CheY-like chemotaxis protein
MTRTILLADDSVTIQKVIELTFMDEDYSVVAVSSGSGALDKLAAVTPDLVIADVHMPGASGYEVVRRAKELHPGVPAILLVGTFEPFDEREAEASGADAHLKKPFDSQELIALVGRLLEPAAGGGAAAPAPAAEPATAASAAAASTAADWPDEPFPIDDPSRGAATTEGDVFHLEPEPELELDLEPAGDSDFEALFSTPEPEILAKPPAGVAEEDLLAVDDSPFSPFVEEEGEPFRLGDDDLMDEEDEDTVAESPFRPEAAAVTADEALDRAHEQAPSAPLAEPAHVAGFVVETEEVAGVAEPAPPAAAEAPRGPLSDADVERIARRLAEVVGERVVREVAWEVIPDLAEVVIKDRLRELEGQID